MKFLLLSHDLDKAKDWALSQVPNMHIIDEREIAKENPSKFKLGFHDSNYSQNICELMAFKSTVWQAKRPVIFLMDMRHQMATEMVSHDHSILLYDHSMSRRIAYNPTYVVDFTVDFTAEFPVDI